MTARRLGICTGSGHWADAHAAGFDFVELGCAELLYDQDEAAFAPVRRKLIASPIPVEALNCFLPGHRRVTGPAVDWGGVAAHMETVLRRAGEIGVSVLVFGSGGARRIPEGWPRDQAEQQWIQAVRMAGDLGARFGVTVVLEPLFQKACNFFNRVDQGCVWVDRLDHPRVRLLADLYHMAWEAEPLEHLEAAGSRLAHVHLATPCLPELGDDGGPGYDVKGFLAHLDRAGYTGRISVEDNPGLLRRLASPGTTGFRLIHDYLRA